MNMKQFNRIAKQGTLLIAITLFVASCSKDEEYNTDEELSQTELKTILETDDIAGAVDSALSEIYLGKDNSSNKVEECYTAEYSETGFTATFENCNLNGTENINGTLSVVYATEDGQANFTATYTDFYVGTIKINGTRAYVLNNNESEESISFSVSSNMTVTMDDGSTIAESGTKTFTIDYSEGLSYSISGTWTLETDGDTYKVAVGSALSGDLSCGYVTSGDMTVEKNGLIVSVDFGDGTCDDMATLTYPNGATEDISLKD